MPKELDRLPNRLRLSHQKRVGGMNHPMVLHPFDLRPSHRYLPVVRPIDHEAVDPIHRAIARDNAELELDSAQSIRNGIGSRPKLGAGRPVDRPEQAQMTEEIDHLTALVGRPQHDHSPQSRNRSVGQIITDQDASHGVGHEVNPSHPVQLGMGECFTDHSRGKILNRGGARSIIDVDHDKARLPQGLLHREHRSTRAGQPVQQNDPFQTTVKQGGRR